jgi:hypothetical protein
MVYQHLSNCFIQEDPSSWFSKLFQIVVIVCGDILRLVTLVSGASRFLAMVNDIDGLCPITIGEVFL